MTNEDKSDHEKDSTCTTTIDHEPISLKQDGLPLSDLPLKERVAIITFIIMLSSEYASLTAIFWIMSHIKISDTSW